MGDSEKARKEKPEHQDASAQGLTPTGGRQFGMMPGKKDESAARAAIRQREPVHRGVHPDYDNPTPPADVGTGHIGLGPARGEEEEEPEQP